jgi:hypothetical protein
MSITTSYQHIPVSGKALELCYTPRGSTTSKSVKRRVIALLYLVFVLPEILSSVDLSPSDSGHWGTTCMKEIEALKLTVRSFWKFIFKN